MFALPKATNIKPIAHNLFPTASFALQKKAEGTGDAVRLGLQVAPKNAKRVLVLYGDTPFLSSKTLRNLIKQEGDVVILGFKADKPNHYGRILFDNKMLSKKKSIAKKPNKIPVKIYRSKRCNKKRKGINILQCRGNGFRHRLCKKIFAKTYKTKSPKGISFNRFALLCCCKQSQNRVFVKPH